jgi:serine/threonine protein phosphatase 1
MKRYIIGDIHGCYDELFDLLVAIDEHAKGQDKKLIFVGDYVDRGPNSKGVIDLVIDLQKLGHIALMGNHEDMILTGEYSYAAQTILSFDGSIHGVIPDYALNWMRSLSKYYEDDTILVAHAGMHPEFPPQDQQDAWLLWYRYQRNAPAGLSKHFYHGHTPMIGSVEQAVDRTNVDTGCVYGGHLTAAVVGDDGKPEGFLHVPSKQHHR